MLYFSWRKSTHSKVDASSVETSSLWEPPLPFGRQERHYFLCLLFLLSRKFSNATNSAPNDISKLITPSTTITVSKAVILRTSPPFCCYSGKPVSLQLLGGIPLRFAAVVAKRVPLARSNLSWVLSCVFPRKIMIPLYCCIINDFQAKSTVKMRWFSAL